MENKTLLIGGETPVYFQPTVYQIIKYLYFVETKKAILQDQISIYLDAILLQRLHREIQCQGVVRRGKVWVKYSYKSFQESFGIATLKLVTNSFNRLEECGLIKKQFVPIKIPKVGKVRKSEKEWYFTINYGRISDGLRTIQTLKAKGITDFRPKKYKRRKK